MAKLSRTIGPDKNYFPQGRTVRYDGLYVGYVKDNSDIQRMGRLRVWIPEFGSKDKDESSWITVSYSSPFAGATNPDLLSNNSQTNEGTQTSYGWWAVPPDLENQVLVMFANSDPTRGIAIGFLFQQFMNKMVPGMPADKSYQFPQTDVPVAEYNKRTNQTIKDDITRPAQTTTAEGINAQGLIKDEIRGISRSGARREAPSEVYGLLTPGPKNPSAEGKRLGGSQFYFDDSAGNEHIRVRTKSGAQLLIDETNGLVYAINKAGTSWMQMDAEGNFDVFGAKSVSVRAQEDINLRADNDINIEAGHNIIMRAAADRISSSEDGSIGEPLEGDGGEITIEAANDFTLASVQGNMNTSVLDGDHDITVSGSRRTTVSESDDLTVTGNSTTTVNGNINLSSESQIAISASNTFGVSSSNFDISTDGDVGGQGNFVSGNTVYAKNDIKSATMSLNALLNHTHIIASGSSAGKTKPFTSNGGASTVTGPSVNAAAASTPAAPVTPISKTNVLSSFVPPINDTRVTEPVLTVVGRFLTFEPCPEHQNSGNSK